MRNNIPNERKYPDKFSFFLLWFLYPIQNESQSNSSYRGSYSYKVNKHGVFQGINYDKAMIEPHSHLVDLAFTHFRS